MIKRLMFGIALLIATSESTSQEVIIKEQRGEYALDFDKTYTTYITNDIETAITLPYGYKFIGFMPGSKDYVSAAPLQNTMYLSCPVVGENVETNIVFHVRTPEGIEERLVFKVLARSNSPKVLAIHFKVPNASELNRTVEAMRARYQEQLTSTLAEQEDKLTTSVHDTTIVLQRIWFIHGKRKQLGAEYKGATVYLEGMTNSKSDTYFYLMSTIKTDACDIINLKSINSGKNSYMVEHVATNEFESNRYMYVYRTVGIPIKEGKSIPLKLKLQIWSKNVTLKFRAS